MLKWRLFLAKYADTPFPTEIHLKDAFACLGEVISEHRDAGSDHEDHGMFLFHMRTLLSTFYTSLW
jgi:hypothetical protein